MPLLKSRRMKMILAAVILIVVLVGGIFAYFSILINSLSKLPPGVSLPSPTLSGYLNYQGLLSYNYGRYELPFVTVVYNTTNSVQLNSQASIFVNPPPMHLYILNYSSGCYGGSCRNASAVVQSMLLDIKDYGMSWLYANASYVSIDNVSSIQNDSILIILNGLLPSQLADSNYTELKSLMARQTSIVYVGLNFSSIIIPGAVPTQENTSSLPTFLQTYPVRGHGLGGVYTFNSPTFEFRNGLNYHFVTYENVGNGSLVAFPNTLSSWSSEKSAGADLAKAIWQEFWLQRYAYGSTTGVAPNGGIGSIGIEMNGTQIPYNASLPSTLSNGYLRIVIGASPLYASQKTAYMYITGRPVMGTRGIVAIAPELLPNASDVAMTFNITSKPANPINLSTYIGVYGLNMSPFARTPGPSVHGFSVTSPPFIVHQDIGLGPGKYVVMLINGSDNTEIAGGYFYVPPYVITPLQLNFTSDKFAFKITSGGVPVGGIRYNLTLDGLYPENGVVESGIIAYTLPQGTSGLTGPLDFAFGMLSQVFHYKVNRQPSSFAINSQYIELGAVVVMMLLMVMFVRAPQKDEFYIDVPNLPEGKKIDISMKSTELLSVFDKLNANYHWHYMPLSKTEVKSAIALNIKYNNIPVELTYRNIEAILDSLAVSKLLVSADELYAPATWIEASKHDITYLATFKKLRLYFVTHNHIFTELDSSDEADIVATLHGDKKYLVIYSQTSRFKNVPMYPGGARTYLVFLNSDAMEEFRSKLYDTSSMNAEKLKMYIAADYIRLVEADNIEKAMG